MSLFPLPAEVFEEYMWLDDRKHFPMSVHVRLQFRGQLNRPALETALVEALLRHPLLRAKLQRRRQGIFRRWRWEWVADDSPTLPVEWLVGKVTKPFPHTPHLDLTTVAGMRAWVTGDEQSPSLIVHVHHAAADGLGTFAFVSDWLLAYARLTSSPGATSPPPASLPTPQLERLKGRGRFGLSWWKLFTMLPDQLVGLLGAKEFLSHRPVPLIPVAAVADSPANPPALPTDFPTAITSPLLETSFLAYRQVAKQTGATVNDLLIRDLLVAIDRWRKIEDIPATDDWLRMSVPMNLRLPADVDTPACNMVSMVFIDRRPSEVADPVELLTSITEQMSLIKRKKLGLTFIFSLQAARRLPGGVVNMTRESECRSSTVLSNLGEPLASLPLPSEAGKLVVGDVRLEGLEVLAPIRPLTQATVAVFTYGGQLCASLHYDSRQMSLAQATSLSQTFAQVVQETAAG